MGSESFKLWYRMKYKKVTTPYSKITELRRDILPLKEFVMRKTKPISCFSYENDIFWVVTLFTKQGRYNDELILLILQIDK